MYPTLTQESVEIKRQYDTNHRSINAVEKSKDVLFWNQIPSIMNERNNSTRYYLDNNLSVDTSAKSISFRNNLRKKHFINLSDSDTYVKIKLVSLKSKIDYFIKYDKVDKALIEVFKTLDSLYIDDSKYDFLFKMFIGNNYDDEINVGLLSATINAKKNRNRIEYFNFVNKQLEKKYSKNEIESIISGL